MNPTDQVSFNFGKIEHEYKEQTKGGTLGGTVKAKLRSEEDAGKLSTSPAFQPVMVRRSGPCRETPPRTPRLYSDDSGTPKR